MDKSKHKLVGFAIDHPKLIVTLAAIITIALAIPIRFAKIDTDPENMLAQTEPVRVNHSRIKDEFNLSDYLVVGFVGERDLLTEDFTERLALLTERIEEMAGCRTVD